MSAEAMAGSSPSSGSRLNPVQVDHDILQGRLEFPSHRDNLYSPHHSVTDCSKGKERAVSHHSPGDQHSLPGSSRQRQTSDGFLDGLLCAANVNSCEFVESPEATEELERLSEDLPSPLSPFAIRQGLAMSGQSHFRQHRRQSSFAPSTHTQGTSSLGTSGDFDYFAARSFASTAPTSVISTSPVSEKGHQMLKAWSQESEVTSNEGKMSPASQDVSTGCDHSVRHRADRPFPTLTESSYADDGDHEVTAPVENNTMTDRIALFGVSSQESNEHIQQMHQSDSSPHVQDRVEDHNAPHVVLSPRDRFRQAFTFRRSDSAPNLFHDLSGTMQSGASTPAIRSPQRLSTPRSTKSSLSERPAFLKPTFWRRDSHGNGPPSEHRDINLGGLIQTGGRPPSPASFSLNRRSLAHMTPGSSRSSSPRRLSRAAKVLFTRGTESGSRLSKRTPSDVPISNAVQLSYPAVHPTETAVSSTKEGSPDAHILARRPTLLRAALSSSASASTAVTPWVFADAIHSDEPSLDYFGLLPRELQHSIFAMLLTVHESDHLAKIARDEYRGRDARYTEYVGSAAGLRELIKLTRVSKTWKTLALDGQLWTKLSAIRLPGLTREGLIAVAKAAQTFVREIDLIGVDTVDDVAFETLSNCLAGCSELQTASRALSTTTSVSRLTHINLQGLRHITTASLHHLLDQSPHLVSARLSNLPSVTNETCGKLAVRCRKLRVLEVSRCANLNGHSFRHLQYLSALQVLRAVGVKKLDAQTLGDLMRMLSGIQTIDLSYSDLDDSCLAAMTAHHGPDIIGPGIDDRRCFELTASQSIVRGKSQFRAVIPSMKHLAISSTFITDRGLASLAFGALPHLEVLEIANNRGIRDPGLVALLESSPYLRRLDLEGATEITNKVLAALTPASNDVDGKTSSLHIEDRVPSPGNHLTHLILSQCRRLDTTSLLALMQACPKLHHLEVDDTNANDAFAVGCLKIMISTSRLHHDVKGGERRPYCLSLIDCRALTRPGCNTMLNSAVIRPRLGRRGFRYRPFNYGDLDISPGPLKATDPWGTATSATQTSKMLDDECNMERICVKTFWFWQAIDAKERKAKKNEKKRKKDKSQSGSTSPVGAGSEGSSSTESAARGLSRALLGGGRGSDSHGGGGRTLMTMSRSDRNRAASGHLQRTTSPLSFDGANGEGDRMRERGHLFRWTRGLFLPSLESTADDTTTTTEHERETMDEDDNQDDEDDEGRQASCVIM